MDITLIICAYNEESCIGETLDVAIQNSCGRFKEIIVVDNASTDRTAEIARSRLGVRVILEPHKGLTSARQAGFETATSQLLAYIDADTLITPQWFDVAQHVFSKCPDIASLSGPRRYFGTNWYRRWILNSFWAGAPIMYWSVGFMVFGGNFIVQRSALGIIGGFDRSIAFYGEDTDLACRLSKVGKTLFRMDFYVYASARRFDSEGIWRPNFVYLLNYLWPALFGRPFTKNYQDVR